MNSNVIKISNKKKFNIKYQQWMMNAEYDHSDITVVTS